MKKSINHKNIDGNDFVHKETGETLESFAPGVRSVKQVDENMIILDSDEYVILDSAALSYVQDNFSPTDLGRIMKMTDMTYGEFNILYNGIIPHTTSSLMEELEYSRNKFSNFMTRLHKKSIIYYIEGYFDGKKKKYIMLNPHLARKRKTFNKQCVSVFENIKNK